MFLDIVVASRTRIVFSTRHGKLPCPLKDDAKALLISPFAQRSPVRPAILHRLKVNLYYHPRASSRVTVVVNVPVCMRGIGEGRMRQMRRRRRQLNEGDVVSGRGGRIAWVARVTRRARIVRIAIAVRVWVDPRVAYFQEKQVLVDVISDHIVINFRCNSATGYRQRSPR